MDLPQDVYQELFQHLQKRDFQAVASVAKGLEKASQSAKQTLVLGQDGVTAFYKGYQLTGYQHAMLKHLLKHGAQAPYRCVPDTHNLFVIVLLLMMETNSALAFSKGGIMHPPFVDFVHKSIFRELIGVPKMKRWTDPPTILPTVKVGEIELFLGAPTSHLGLVHPEYANVQRYPVWVSPTVIRDTSQLPGGKVVLLENNFYALEPIVGNLLTIPKTRRMLYPLTLKNCQEMDVFVVHGAKKEEVYNLYSLLTQVPSTYPKILIVNDTVNNQDGIGHIPGYVPLPFKFLYELPEENIKEANLFLVNSFKNLCYAELLILEYYNEDNEGDLDIGWRVRPVMEWLEYECGRTPSIEIKNPQKNMYFADGKVISTDRKGKLQVSRKGTTSLKALPDSGENWLFIDPLAEVGEEIKTTAELPSSNSNTFDQVLKANLQKIIAHPRATVADLTKDKLLEMCKREGIRCSSKDTRATLAEKLLNTL